MVKTSSTSSYLRLTSLLLVALWATPSHAYLDPGTGSLIIQGIIGAIAAAGVTCRLYWYKIREFFGDSKVEDETIKDTASDET